MINPVLQTCKQIALAIRDEGDWFGKKGIRIIQNRRTCH